MKTGRFLFFGTLTLVFSTILMVFLLLPSDAFPSHKIFSIDKVWHFGSYFLLMLLMILAFKQIDGSPKYYKLLAFVMTLLHACTSEWFQQYSPGRTSDITDWVADIVGILLALLLVNVIQAISEKSIINT